MTMPFTLIISAMCAGVISILLYMAYRGVKTSRIHAGFIVGYIERIQAPFSFWILAFAYIAGAAGVAFFWLTQIFRKFLA